jgi:hypothetical protein
MMVFFENPEPLINKFNELAEQAQRKAYITIGIEIQKEEINNLKKYREELLNFKKEFILKRLESEANLIFCIESTLRVLQYELEMLVHIKEDEMSQAWSDLVNAQVIFGNVIGNYPFKTEHLNFYMERLSNYEQLLFPKLHFQSVGGIIKKSKCSICDDDYQNCDHIKGKLYMGEMCCRVITEMELEEISLVENPANKHCRVLTIETNGKKIDILTLREQG